MGPQTEHIETGTKIESVTTEHTPTGSTGVIVNAKPYTELDLDYVFVQYNTDSTPFTTEQPTRRAKINHFRVKH